MGGRGSSSGVSSYKEPHDYGTQYRALFTAGNVKFVTKVNRDSEDLMETMTPGRVYAVIGGDRLTSIVYFDRSNKRVKQIDLDHPHKGMDAHTHHGYFHNENDSPKGAAGLTPREKAMVARAQKLWDEYKRKKGW